MMFLIGTIPGAPRSETDVVAAMLVRTDAPQPQLAVQRPGFQLFAAHYEWVTARAVAKSYGQDRAGARMRAIMDLEAMYDAHARYWIGAGIYFEHPTELVLREMYELERVIRFDVVEEQA